jgi:hypothetical protein
MVRIYLCDLAHDTITVSIDSMPIGIGFIASYAKKLFSDRIDLKLFRTPSELLSAIKSDPPNIIGVSNYCWSSNLSYYFLKKVKSIDSDIVTVMGGPNFPKDINEQRFFLEKRKDIDFYSFEESEISFSNLLDSFFSNNGSLKKMKKQPIPGVLYLSSTNDLIHGGVLDRLKELDDIPSPYLTGFLDKFFYDDLNPYIQTNRGCPFKCTFCHEGDTKYFKTINSFSTNRVFEELDYIAEKIQGQGSLGITDSNFLMYKRDIDICKKIRTMQDSVNYPKMINVTTGKNRQERILEGINMLKEGSMAMTASVQSMDSYVLENIQRTNIKYEDYIDIQNDIHDRNSEYVTMSEMIIPLPGESKKSFFQGVEKLINSGLDKILPYTLMMLEGTELNTPQIRQKYCYKTKFRVIPRSFSSIDNDNIIEFEEVGISTKDMSFDDYIECRMFSLFLVMSYNSRVFEPLYEYISRTGLEVFDFIMYCYEKISGQKDYFDLFSRFKGETIGELWESEKDIIKFFNVEENYDKLLSGEYGSNLLQKYWVEGYVLKYKILSNFLFKGAIDYVGSNGISCNSETELELENIKIYIEAKRKEVYLLNKKSQKYLNLDFDVGSWVLDKKSGKRLHEYNDNAPFKFSVTMSDSNKKRLIKLYKQYGSSNQSIGKISTRLNVSSFCRDIDAI